MQKQLFTYLLLLTTLMVSAQRNYTETQPAAAPSAASAAASTPDKNAAFKRELSSAIKIPVLAGKKRCP